MKYPYFGNDMETGFIQNQHELAGLRKKVVIDYKDNKRDIVDHFGRDFYTKVEALVEPLISRWHIEALELINSFSASLVFKGISTIHGPVVMKFARDKEAILSEMNALKYFEGNGICKWIDVDIENGVLLEEALIPGIELVSEKQLEKRVAVFCDMYHQLHKAGHKHLNRSRDTDYEYNYKSYMDWIFKITDYMEKEIKWKEVAAHMKRAKTLFLKLAQEYTAQSLLHGDFHYYNILKSGDCYKVIDPKGVIGNPIFDIPRYVLNEFMDERDRTKVDETMDTVFNLLSDNLNLPKSVLSVLLYIEGAMAICWFVESGAKVEEKADFLEKLSKLEAYMSQHADRMLY